MSMLLMNYSQLLFLFLHFGMRGLGRPGTMKNLSNYLERKKTENTVSKMKYFYLVLANTFENMERISINQ